jgi:hypothetical protein
MASSHLSIGKEHEGKQLDAKQIQHERAASKNPFPGSVNQSRSVFIGGIQTRIE